MAEEKKDEDKIVMETRMHCGHCRSKVYKAIIGYPGVEDLTIDLKNNKIMFKAPKVDAKKLFEAVKKKSGGQITKLLHHPKPKDVKKEDEKKEEKKPVEVTVVLKGGMDCSSCRKKAQIAALNIKDVQSVKVAGDILTIKGWDLDEKKVCDAIIKKTRKHVEVVPPKKDGDKSEGGKQGEKKEGEKKDESAKKDEKPNPQIVVGYAYPPHPTYPPQYFSDENPNACVLM